MKNNNFSIILKIFILTGVFFVIINYSGYLLNAQKPQESQENENIQSYSGNENISNFVNQDVDIIGGIGVAVTTNIGTKLKQTQEIPVEITKENVVVGEAVSNQNTVNDKIITPNMVFLFEYINVLKTDVRSLLSTSSDRSFALNSFIAQLEYRYKQSGKNSQDLLLYRAELLKRYNGIEAEINNLKDKMSSDFTKFNSTQTTKNIDNFLELKEKSNKYKTYIVFIDKFLNLYSQLNEYNKGMLDVLINNKDALVKNSHVVIPNNGGELLKDLNLIYDEKDFKSSK